MAIDMSEIEVGEEPQARTPYIWRVSGVSCKKSNDNDNRRLDMRACIVDGACTGFEAKFPPMMLFDAKSNMRTTQWLGQAVLKLRRLLGDPQAKVILPTKAGEVTPTMTALINVYFEAFATYIPEKENDVTGQVYEAHWEVGRVIGLADPTNLVEIDWAAAFA